MNFQNISSRQTANVSEAATPRELLEFLKAEKPLKKCRLLIGSQAFESQRICQFLKLLVKDDLLFGARISHDATKCTLTVTYKTGQVNFYAVGAA